MIPREKNTHKTDYILQARLCTIEAELFGLQMALSLSLREDNICTHNKRMIYRNKT